MEIEVIPTEFISENQTIRGNFVKPKGDGPFPGICKFHGLPGSSDQVNGIAVSLAAAGFLVLTFDFRGFRKSEGSFSLSGEIEDAQSAVSHLIVSEWIYRDWIGVYGASFGGAIAICSAALDSRIRSICVRAPVYDTKQFVDSELAELVFHDVKHTVPDEMHDIRETTKQREMFDSLKRDVIRYNPMNDICKLTSCAIFITTGDSDILIDSAGVSRLYERAKEPKKMVIIKEADHNLSNMTARRKTESGVIEWFEHQFNDYLTSLRT